MEQSKNLFLGVVVTLVSYLFFAVTSIFVKGLSDSIPVMQILFFQSAVGWILMLVYGLRNKELLDGKTSFLKLHLTRDFFGLFSFFAYYLAIPLIGLVESTILSYTTPFMTPFVGKVWLKVKTPKSIWWLIILGFLGVVFILNPLKKGLGFANFGVILGLFSAFCSAIALVSIEKLHQKKEPIFRTLYYFFFVGTIVCLPFALVFWRAPSFLEWFLLLGVGLSMGVAQLTLTYAYRHGSASALSPLSYTMLFYLTAMNFLFFHQTVSQNIYLGGGLIILGGTLSLILSEKLKEKKWWKFWQKKEKL